MPRRAHVLLLCVALAPSACDRGKASGAAETAPSATAVAELEMPVPHVALSASDVTLDGSPAGSVPTAGTVAPVAELLTKLRVRRATVLSEGKDAPTDPRSTIEVPEQATARALKILLETASRGNYPATTIVVGRGAPGQWSRALGYDVAAMERPRDRDDGAPAMPARLLVTVRDAAFVVEARSGQTPVVPERAVPRREGDASASYTALGAAAREVLATTPRAAAGQPREAVIFVPDAMPVAALRPVLDALAAAEPGLALRLHRADAPPPAEAPRNGALVIVKGVVVPDGQAPERVFYGLRGAQAKLRGCYEAAHAAHPALRGIATLRFSIAASGELSAVKLDAAKSTASDPALATCLTSVVGSVTLARAATPMEASCQLELDFVD